MTPMTSFRNQPELRRSKSAVPGFQGSRIHGSRHHQSRGSNFLNHNRDQRAETEIRAMSPPPNKSFTNSHEKSTAPNTSHKKAPNLPTNYSKTYENSPTSYQNIFPLNSPHNSERYSRRQTRPSNQSKIPDPPRYLDSKYSRGQEKLLSTTSHLQDSYTVPLSPRVTSTHEKFITEISSRYLPPQITNTYQNLQNPRTLKPSIYTQPIEKTITINRENPEITVKEVKIPIEVVIEVGVPRVIENYVTVDVIIEIPIEKVIELEVVHEVVVERHVDRYVDVPVEIYVEKVYERVVEVEVDIEIIEEVEKVVEVEVEVEYLHEEEVFRDQVIEIEASEIYRYHGQNILP
jgi:hypothetical protein